MESILIEFKALMAACDNIITGEGSSYEKRKKCTELLNPIVNKLKEEVKKYIALLEKEIEENNKTLCTLLDKRSSLYSDEQNCKKMMSALDVERIKLTSEIQSCNNEQHIAELNQRLCVINEEQKHNHQSSSELANKITAIEESISLVTQNINSHNAELSVCNNILMPCNEISIELSDSEGNLDTVIRLIDELNNVRQNMLSVCTTDKYISGCISKGESIIAGGNLMQNEYLISNNKRFVAVTQSDNNFVVCNSEGPICASGTYGANDAEYICFANNNLKECFNMEKRGIDVSFYQGKIDFSKVKASGISFVIIRAGYGKHISQKDRFFEENYKNAKASSLDVGVYWYSYADSIDCAQKEAETCLEAIKGKRFEYPIFFDLEEHKQFAKGKKFCSDLVRTFCDTMEKRGYYPGLYISRSPLQNYIEPEVAKRYALWVAEYGSRCHYDGTYGMWQYSDKGTIPGINGKVDLDLAYIDYPKIIKSKKLNGYK